MYSIAEKWPRRWQLYFCRENLGKQRCFQALFFPNTKSASTRNPTMPYVTKMPLVSSQLTCTQQGENWVQTRVEELEHVSFYLSNRITANMTAYFGLRNGVSVVAELYRNLCSAQPYLDIQLLTGCWWPGVASMIESFTSSFCLFLIVCRRASYII